MSWAALRVSAARLARLLEPRSLIDDTIRTPVFQLGPSYTKGDDKPHLSLPLISTVFYVLRINTVCFGISASMSSLVSEAAITVDEVIRICSQLASEGVTPSAAKARERAGVGGSLSTYQSGVNKWKARIAQRIATTSGATDDLPPAISELVRQIMDAARDQARDELTDTKRALDSKLEQAEAQSQKSLSDVAKADAALKAAAEVRGTLERHIATLADVIRNRDSQIEMLGQRVAELKNNLADERSALDASKNRDDALSAELASKTALVARLESHASDLNRDLAAAKQASDSRIESKDQELRHMEQIAEKTQKQMAREVERLEKRVSVVESKLDREQSRHSATQVQLAEASARATAAQQQIKGLLAQLERREGDIKDLQKVHRDELAQAEAALKEQRANIREMKRELRESIQQNKKLTRRVRQFEPDSDKN